MYWWDGCFVDWNNEEVTADFETPWQKSPRLCSETGHKIWNYWIETDSVNPYVKFAIDGVQNQIVVVGLADGSGSETISAIAHYTLPNNYTRSVTITIPINGRSDCASPSISPPETYDTQKTFVIG